LQGLKAGNKQSNCAKNLLDNDHSVGRIEDILSVLRVTKKEGHTNTVATCPVEIKTQKNTLELVREVLLGKILYSLRWSRMTSLGTLGCHLVLERQACGQYSGTCRGCDTTQT
jgi:hypothetical protein